MSDELLNIVKRTAVNAVKAEKMSNLVIGRVVTLEPFAVELDNIGVLSHSFFTILRPLTSTGEVDTTFDTTVLSNGTVTASGTASGTIELTVSGEDIQPNTRATGNISLPVTTQGSVQVNGQAHSGGIKTVKSKADWVNVGDEIALLRYKGGNKYLILGAIMDISK